MFELCSLENIQERHAALRKEGISTGFHFDYEWRDKVFTIRVNMQNGCVPGASINSFHISEIAVQRLNKLMKTGIIVTMKKIIDDTAWIFRQHADEMKTSVTTSRRQLLELSTDEIMKHVKKDVYLDLMHDNNLYCRFVVAHPDYPETSIEAVYK